MEARLRKRAYNRRKASESGKKRVAAVYRSRASKTLKFFCPPACASPGFMIQYNRSSPDGSVVFLSGRDGARRSRVVGTSLIYLCENGFGRVTNAPVAEREDPPEFLKLVVTQEEECKFSLQEFGFFQVFAFPRRVFSCRSRWRAIVWRWRRSAIASSLWR